VPWAEAAALESRAAHRQATSSDQKPVVAAMVCCQVVLRAVRWGPSNGSSRAGPELMARCASAAEARRATWPSMPCTPGTRKPHPPWRSGRCSWVGDVVRSTAAMSLAAWRMSADAVWTDVSTSPPSRFTRTVRVRCTSPGTRDLWSRRNWSWCPRGRWQSEFTRTSTFAAWH
jgi:hypothetical protein